MLRRLQPSARVLVWSSGLAAIVLVACLDYWVGSRIALSFFYSVPVALLGWRLGKRAGVVAAAAAALAWLGQEAAANAPVAITVWNPLVGLAFFSVVAIIFDEMRKARDRIQRLALSDPLTGLPNSRVLHARLEHEIARARRSGQPFSVVFLDLDDFKLVNDRYGHQVGDRVLQAVAACVQARLRATDLVARSGGDEFVLLLPETDLAGSRRAIESVRSALQTEMRRRGWPTTFSFGLAVFDQPPASRGEAIRAADELMYQVKHQGKDGIAERVFGPMARDAEP